MDLPEIYQLRIWLKKISPMIWRRLLLKSDTSLADLHHYIQIALGWENDYLHQFFIHGKAYGISYVGGISFSDNAQEVFLRDFHFRVGEKFTYEYNFFVPWELEIRIEKALPVDPKKNYPLCIDGSRAAPPEYCQGPAAFMELEDYYTPWQLEIELLRLIEEDQEESREELYERINDTLEQWEEWMRREDQFDRQDINHQLQEYLQEVQALACQSIKEKAHEN